VKAPVRAPGGPAEPPLKTTCPQMVAPVQSESEAPTILIRSVDEFHVPELKLIVAVVVTCCGIVVGANVIEITDMLVDARNADV